MSRKGKLQTKSVEVMLNNFHKDFKSGLSISQIAEKYDVGKSYIYKLLEKIAGTNGVTREYYLEREHSPHNIPIVYYRKNAYTHYNEEMLQNIRKSFDNVIVDISNLVNNLEEFNSTINNDIEEEN